MRSILLMTVKNLKKKKLQNMLIALIICVSAMVLSTGVGMLQGFNSPVTKMFKELNASQDILYIPEGMYNIDEVTAWWQKQPDISGVSVYPSYSINTKISIKGKKVDKSLMLTERENVEAPQDKLMIIEGTHKNSPDKGEIWVPTAFAYSYNIKVGDILNIPTKNGTSPMKVSAIVVDPHSSSPLMGTVIVWIASGEIQNIFNSKANTILMGTHYKDYSKVNTVWNDFEKFLKAPFGGYRNEYKAFEYLYTTIFKISASILVVFSLIVIICTVFIIAFTISNSILGDYKIIGILKSQGFTSRQIQFIYQLQFLLLSIVSIPIGVFISYFCINKILSSLLKTTGINSLDSSMLEPTLITFVLILAVIISVTYLSSKKVCRIKPSDAIKSGTPESNIFNGNYANLLKLKSFSTPFSLAIKEILSYKRQSLFVVITLFLTSFVFTGTINSYNSLLKLGQNLTYWGFDNSEVTAQFPSEYGLDSENNIIKTMRNDDRIASIIPWNWSSASYKTENSSSKVIETLVYDGDMNSIGIANIRGRNPIAKDEVSLAINTSKDMKKDIGDSVDLYIQGIKKSFIVTGIYQSFSDSGTGARLQKKSVKEHIDANNESFYSIKLKNKASTTSFINEMQSKYDKKIDIRRTYDEYGTMLSSITNNLAYALLFLIVIFTIVTFIIVFNVTLISIYQQKKGLGIFKAIGMTNKQIRISLVYKMVSESIIGILLGMPAGIIIIPKLVGMMISGIGLVRFPFIITLLGTIAVIPVSLIIVIIGVWISSVRVLKIKLCSLINE